MTVPSCKLQYTFSAYRPSVSLIIPLRTQYFQTPMQAFRFVSLIPFDRNLSSDGTRIERWNSFHSFLTKGSGDIEDHCSLLCSLLIGFGLDAYVAIGTNEKQPHLWVLTLEKTSSTKNVYFWETMTGQRLEVSNPRVTNVYKTLSCVFNDKFLYANLQTSNFIPNLTFDFHNFLHWKSLNCYSNVPKWNFPMSLIQTSIKAQTEHLEEILKEKINEYRNDITKFDDSLSYKLLPAVTKCELEKVHNIKISEEEFEASMSLAVPPNHIFKAFSIQAEGIDVQKVFMELVKNKVTKEILNTKEDNIKFGIKTKITSYPENIYITWISIAVIYKE